MNSRNSTFTTAEIEAMLPAFHEALARLKPTERQESAANLLHAHGAFDDLTAHLSFIQLAGDALRGIGAMMLPETGDHQMNMAFSSDASAVFSFFGEALKGPITACCDATERLQWATEKSESNAPQS